MFRPNDLEILATWEEGMRQHPVDRALTVLRAFTGEPKEDLARLSIGRRDQLLLRARVMLLGDALHGYAECPACVERLEFEIPFANLETERACDDDARDYRLPDSFDLAAIAGLTEVEPARALLIERCGIDPDRPELLNEISTRESPVEVHLECPACARESELPLDIASYFWEELCAYSRRRLREVDALARAYGWNEREILGLGSERRQAYLEMVS